MKAAFSSWCSSSAVAPRSNPTTAETAWRDADNYLGAWVTDLYAHKKNLKPKVSAIYLSS